MINTNPHGVFDEKNKSFSQVIKCKSKEQKEFTCIQFSFNSRDAYPLDYIDYVSFFYEIHHWYKLKAIGIPNQMFVIHAGKNYNPNNGEQSPIVELNIMPDDWLIYNEEEGLSVVRAGAFKHNFKPITVTTIKIEEVINNFSRENLLKLQKEFVNLYGTGEMNQEKANSFAVGFGKACELIIKQLQDIR